MGKHGAKNRRRRREKEGSTDRISKLPKPILHHILCFLSQKEAIQTCVLSKSWRHLGITRPKIEFHQSILFPDHKEKFMSLFDKTLQRYHDQNLSIQEFILSFFPIENPQWVAVLENRILLVLQKGVKIFDFDFRSVTYSSLPSLIFQTQSLEELYLGRCHFNNSVDKVLSKHLRTLALRNVFIADETLNKIFSSCPLLEYVVLHRCNGLTTITLNEVHNLKHFECFCSCVLKFDEYRDLYFPRLKMLSLERVRLPTKSLDIFSCKFPCLEELKLVSCDGFEQVRLSSPSIKRLTIKLGSKNSIKAWVIDAPSILWFDFYGDSPPMPFSITKTSNEWKSQIHLTCRGLPENDAFSTWLLELNKLLRALTQSHISLTLCCFHYRVSQFTDFPWLCYPMSQITFCDSYEPVQVENLIANCHLLYSDFPDSLNLLFRTCRPMCITDMYLYVDAKYEWQNKHNKRVDSLCNIFLEESGETMSEFSFWKHDLKEASMESFDENAKEWRLFQGTSWSECAFSNNQSKQQIRIRLKWRELK